VTRSDGSSLTHIALTRQLLLASWKNASPPTVGTPTECRRRRFQPPPVDRVPSLAEAQPVEQRHRPSAHRDDVSEDPADPGGRALEGLYCGRVVVRLDLEGDRLALAEVEHAAFSPGPWSTRSPSLENRLSSRAECL
jgi:hypothetical protein